jgi:hypothetical protein
MPDPFFLALSHEETVLISSVEKEDAPPIGGFKSSMHYFIVCKVLL